VERYIKEIVNYSEQDDVVSIALNVYPPINVDFVFASKETVLDSIENDSQKIIVTSNTKTEKGIKINYATWTKWSGGNSDSALIVMLNVLKYIGVKSVALAGCDGFEADVDCNDFDEKLKRPVTKEQAERRNARAKSFLDDIKKQIEISFITPSKYQ
jgi:4-hydroxy 2-oxovalerate aldolase